jgi:hypothetical protein
MLLIPVTVPALVVASSLDSTEPGVGTMAGACVVGARVVVVGMAVGRVVGTDVGWWDGTPVGTNEGRSDGTATGKLVGTEAMQVVESVDWHSGDLVAIDALVGYMATNWHFRLDDTNASKLSSACTVWPNTETSATPTWFSIKQLRHRSTGP